MKKGNHLIEKSKKIYSSRGIFIGSLFGGPLATSLLLASNFKSLNQQKKRFFSLVIGILLTLLIPFLKILLKNYFGDAFLLKFLPLIYSGLLYFILKNYQEKVYLKNISDEEKHSNWRAFGIGLCCLLLILFFIFIYALVIFNNQK